MSRLLELLNEKNVATQDATNDGPTEYKYHTVAGNLFRLMLVTNPDKPVDHIGPQGLVTTMLSEIAETNAGAVKKIQVSFNKIRKAMKEGKKPTGVLKKEYFSNLFDLLLPLTAQPRFKVNPLTVGFAGVNETSAQFQRQYTILIGRALLNNESIKLNARDLSIIKEYIGKFEKVEALSGENETQIANSEKETPKVSGKNETPPESLANETPADDAVTKTIAGKSTEELESLNTQADNALKSIKARTVDKSVELRKLLETNETSETFHVTLTGSDTPVSGIINEKISSFYKQTKLGHGVEVANFATKLLTDSLKRLNSINGYLNFIKGEVDFGIEKIPNGLQLSVKTGKSAGSEHQFFYDTSFITAPDGKFEAHMDKVQVPAGARSIGINKQIFKDTLDLYKAEGVDRITLEANVDVGGYAWFRYGFVPIDFKQIQGIATWMRAVAPLVSESLRYDSKDLAKYINDNTKNKTKGVDNLINLIATGDNSDSRFVINTLLNHCADEFEGTFNSPEKFKNISKNIAFMNFKEYKIKTGKITSVYSISYKALLSIQAMNVQGHKPIPMLKGVYLNWSGVMDMKNLDDTYAYLNMKSS